MNTLHHFIARENDLEGLRELLIRGENPNSQDGAGRTPLHIVVMKSERNPHETDDLLLVARELIDFGANVDLSTHSGKTPLHVAVGSRNHKMIELLLEFQAQVNAVDDNGYTPLHYATSKQRFFGNTVYDTEVETVKLLLKYNPNLNVQSRNRQTALILAVQNSDFPIVSELLEKNASVNLQDENGNTVMHYALHQTELNARIVLELTRYGGSFHVTNDYSISPISFYLRKLMNASRVEVDKAKYVFKLYQFYTNGFNYLQRKIISYISKENNCQLDLFIQFCSREIERMREDELSPNYRVHDIALRGAHNRLLNNTEHLPFQVSDQMIYKLLRHQYLVYRDLICAGICNKYMRKKFAQVCWRIKTGTPFMNFDILYMVSSYLTNFDMLNMMLACAGGWTRLWYLPRFTYYTRCSVS